MEKLCKYVYAHDNTDRLRTRAILSHIYHHALHDNWFQARDLILMSHLQETIQHSDPATQVRNYTFIFLVKKIIFIKKFLLILLKKIIFI